MTLCVNQIILIEMTASASSIKHVWITLPAYNEEQNITSLLERFVQLNSEQKNALQIHVLVIDDGSKDATFQKAKAFEERLPLTIIQHGTNKGLHGGIKTSFDFFFKQLSATPQTTAFGLMDSDDSHHPDQLPSMLNLLLSESLDVVVASRFVKGSKISGVVWWRQLLSLGMALLFKCFKNVPNVMDYSCGYRLYSPKIVQKLYDKYGFEVVSQTNFSCMVELLMNCHDLGAKMKDHPFLLRYDLKKGESKMQFGKTILGTLKVLSR